MIVNPRQPRRAVDVRGGRTAKAVLEELGLAAEAHLVIRNGSLVPSDTTLDETDVVEIRPVISGG